MNRFLAYLASLTFAVAVFVVTAAAQTCPTVEVTGTPQFSTAGMVFTVTAKLSDYSRRVKPKYNWYVSNGPRSAVKAPREYSSKARPTHEASMPALRSRALAKGAPSRPNGQRLSSPLRRRTSSTYSPASHPCRRR